MMTLLALKSALAEANSQILQLQEISSAWNEELVEKLEGMILEVKKIQVEPEVIEREVHPLRNKLVVKKVLDYLLEPSSSISTLKSLRYVSKEFKDYITPKLLIRSRFQFLIKSTIEEWDKMSMVLYYNYPESAEDEEWKNWMKNHGGRVTGLSFTITRWEGCWKETLCSLIQERFPNVEQLSLLDRSYKETENNNAGSIITPDQTLSTLDTSKMKVKQLKVIILNNCDERNVISTTVDLLGSDNLESLMIAVQNVAFDRGNDVWKLFFSTAVSKSRDIFKNLKRLELVGFYPEAVEGHVFNRIELPNLRDLSMHMMRGSQFVPFLELVSEVLEKLEILLVDPTRPPGENEVNFPRMPNLLFFVYSYAKFWNDYTMRRNTAQEVPQPLVLTARNLMDSMPGLKHWKANQGSWDHDLHQHSWQHYNQEWRHNILRSTLFQNYFSDRNCGLGMCTHIQELLETEDDKAFHGNLEKLDLSCSFREPQLISRMASLFKNVKDLSLWIQSPLLSEFFKELASLEKLEVLKIVLSCDVTDFPEAVNLYLPNLENLSEVLFQNGSSHVPESKVPLEDHCIFHIDKAATGFCESPCLKILSFRNMKMDGGELNEFQQKILKNRPDLVVNVFGN